MELIAAVEKEDSETHQKNEIEEMLGKDALVAQELQDIESAEYEERLPASSAAEQRPLEAQSRGSMHIHKKAPEPAPTEAHVHEKTESETHQKNEIAEMLREDAFVAQALQEIEVSEYQERLAAVRAPRKTRRVRNKTRAAKST